MTILILIGGVIWGSLSAQFLVQAITSLIITSIFLVGLAFSTVSKSMNVAGSIASLAQAIFFGALFIGGNWIAGDYIDFLSWNAVSVASLIAFLATIIFVARQVPGKIILARMSAWEPPFAQAVMHRPREERVELARKYRATPTMDTLYPATKPAVPTEDGTTPSSAIRIRAANSLEGIPKEYAALTAMFGSRDIDWKVIERTVIHADDGQKLEKFIVSVSGQRKEVYFDVGDFLNNNDQKTKAALDNLIARHDKALTVLLPKEELMTLQTGVLRLTEENLKQLGISANERKQMLDPLVEAILQWKEKDYASIPEHINVTMMISVWTRIMSLLASWQPGSLLQEEELENLKAIIGGTMKSARNTPG